MANYEESFPTTSWPVSNSMRNDVDEDLPMYTPEGPDPTTLLGTTAFALPSPADLIRSLFSAIVMTEDDAVIRLLTDYPRFISANSRDMNNKTALCAAVETGNMRMVELLLNMGANVDDWSVHGEYRNQKDYYESRQRRKKVGKSLELSMKEEAEQKRKKWQERQKGWARIRREVLTGVQESEGQRPLTGDSPGDQATFVEEVANLIARMSEAAQVDPETIAERVQSELDNGATLDQMANNLRWSLGINTEEEPVLRLIVEEAGGTWVPLPDEPVVLFPEYQVLRTPLMIAAERGYLPIVKLLMRPPCNADHKLCAPDGQIALRLASEHGHREVVKFLPLVRIGGWKRFRHQHAASIYYIRKTTWFIQLLASCIVVGIPYGIYRLSKHIVIVTIPFVAKKMWTMMKEEAIKIKSGTVKLAVKTKNAAVKSTKWIKDELPGAMSRKAKSCGRGIMRFFTVHLVNFAKATWKFTTVTIPNAIDVTAKAIWRFYTVHLPKFLKWLVVDFLWKFLIRGTGKVIVFLAKFVWKVITVHIPELLKTLWYGILAVVRKTNSLLLRGLGKILSLMHLLVAAVVGFFRRITLRDIWNGVEQVLKWVFVEVPKFGWDVAKMTYTGLVNAFIKVFGISGEVLIWIWHALLYLALYIPQKLLLAAAEVGRLLGKGVREIAVWFNPKM